MLATLLLAAVLTADSNAPVTPAPATPAATPVPAATVANPVEEKEEPKLDFEVEQAAREFRILIYESYRTSREEYDARRALGDELLKAWNKAEQPPRHREAVLAWFNEALQNSRVAQKLTPYAELEDLKTLTVSQKGTMDDNNAKPLDEENIKLPPPFILDLPKVGDMPTGESIFSRIKTMFSVQNKADVVEPAPAKTGS